MDLTSIFKIHKIHANCHFLYILANIIIPCCHHTQNSSQTKKKWTMNLGREPLPAHYDEAHPFTSEARAQPGALLYGTALHLSVNSAYGTISS